MKKTVHFLALAILLVFGKYTYSQTPVEVPDTYNVLVSESINFLDDFIHGDTTATGERNTADAVYILKRGAAYFITNPITNTDWTLRLKAEDGDGARPIIYGYKNASTGDYYNTLFTVKGDLYLEGLAICSWSEFNPEEVSITPRRVIQTSAAGKSIYIDDCVLTAAGDGTIRTQSAVNVLKVQNTIMAQCGNVYDANPGNGRAFDLRDVSIDSLIVQNCSFVDGVDRVFRHYSSAAPIKYVLIDHNTIYNWMAYHGNIGLGYVGDSVKITNNLFVDNFILGNDSTDDARLEEFKEPGEVGPTGAYKMTFVGAVPNDTTAWVVSNNVYSVSSGIQTFYDSHSDAGLDNLIPLTSDINSNIEDSTTAFVKEDGITFSKPTTSLINMAEWYWDPLGANHAKVQTGFSAEDDFDRTTVDVFADSEEFNLSYGTSAVAYSSAINGYPAGDLNWYPELKTRWEAGEVVGIEDEVNPLPVEFTLEQNYPNPFNPSTKIVYSVPQQSKISLEVFDVLGRKVASLVNGVQTAGSHTVEFDASHLSSGVYFYRLSTQDLTLSKKMILMK